MGIPSFYFVADEGIFRVPPSVKTSPLSLSLYAGGICLTDYAEEIYLYITRSSVIWFVYGILLFCCWPLIDKKLFPYDDENKKAIDGPIERFAEWTKLRQSRPGTIFRLVSNSAASVTV